MTIDLVHKYLDFVISKEIGQFFSPPEKDEAIHWGQIEYFNDLYGNVRNFRQDKQTAVIGYGANQRIDRALSPFKAEYSFLEAGSPGGVVTLPGNFYYLIALKTTQYINQLGRSVTRPVQVLNEEEMISRLESQISPVSLSDPIAIMASTGSGSDVKIQLFPDQPQIGKVYYFKKPIAPVFGYTQRDRDFTYDASTSTQLLWNDADVFPIMNKALSYLGVNAKDVNWSAFSEQKNKEGN